MNSILEKIVNHKLGEIEAAKLVVTRDELRERLVDVAAPRDFVGALRVDGHVSLIAEVKKASPSKGIIREDFDPVQIAKQYQAGGASCISVLTDENFFKGHLRYLTAVKNAVEIPVLRKDFVIDDYQVLEARVAGADAVLLIAECLEPEKLKSLHESIEELGMTALVELYEETNIDSVLACSPKLVGVNNRDLNTFEVNLQHSIRMKQLVPSEVTFVSESGIFTNEDVRLLAENQVDAMLVGESLMRSDDIQKAVKSLIGKSAN